MSRLLTSTKKYSMVELYAEKDAIQDQVDIVKHKLANMGTYIPAVKLQFKGDDGMQETGLKVKDMIQKTISENVKEIDNSFSMENYVYVTEELGNEKLADAYRVLGPFNYHADIRK